MVHPLAAGPMSGDRPTHHPDYGTRCRCGHLLDCCADCRGWLVENSPRIADAWEWTLYVWFARPDWFKIPAQAAADDAEFCDRVAFGIVR